MRRALDWYLEPFIGERTQALPPAIREILRLAAYELIYTRADVHATVFEFVNLAKRSVTVGLPISSTPCCARCCGPARRSPGASRSPTKASTSATRYSLPTWLVRQWRGVFGDGAEAICAAVDEPPQSAIVVNTLVASRDETAEKLAALGVETRPSAFVAEALLVERGPAWKAGGDGAWWTQSESSAMAVDVLGPQPGDAILDVCSGRGNKALQIGARLAGQGSLTLHRARRSQRQPP